MNDYELIYMFRQKDEMATEYLLEKYRRVIKIIINSNLSIYTPKGIDDQDLFQEGAIALFYAADSFREDVNAPFYSFAFLCIERQIKTCIRKYNSNSVRQFYNSLSLSMTISEDENLYLYDILSTEKHSKVSYLSVFENDLDELLNSDLITDLEKSILLYKIQGYSYQEIASKLSCTLKHVDNTIQRIKKKMKN